ALRDILRLEAQILQRRAFARHIATCGELNLDTFCANMTGALEYIFRKDGRVKVQLEGKAAPRNGIQVGYLCLTYRFQNVWIFKGMGQVIEIQDIIDIARLRGLRVRASIDSPLIAGFDVLRDRMGILRDSPGEGFRAGIRRGAGPDILGN